MAAMKDSTKKIFKYLQGLAKDEHVTAADVAEALDMDRRVVNGVFTSAIQRKNYGKRVDAEIENADGTHTGVKFLVLTAEGRALDVDADPDAE